jgi:hypothetical protein
MPDITNSKYKAEFWSFWVQYLGPILLHNHFPNAKYYRHFCDLTVIIRTCLQFTITDMQLTELQTDIVKWIQQYERYAFSKASYTFTDMLGSWYYGYKNEHLPACTFNIHALLHIPDYI